MGTNENQPGGKGATSGLLLDDRHVRGDARMIRQSLRWAVSDDVKADLLKRLHRILRKRTVDVMTKDGPVPMEGPADANAIAAARVLAAIEGQNQKDQHHDDGKRVHHEHEHVFQLESKRTRLLTVARRIGVAVNAPGDAGRGAGVVDAVPARKSRGAKS